MTASCIKWWFTESVLNLAKNTVKFLIEDRRQSLLVFITMFVGKFEIHKLKQMSILGFEMAFLTETFSFAYITCTFGPEWVGLILIFFGIANSISSVVLSRLQKYLGRITIFVGGFLINFFLSISLVLEWIYPNPNMVEWYIIFVIFWGIGDSIWKRAIMGKSICMLLLVKD